MQGLDQQFDLNNIKTKTAWSLDRSSAPAGCVSKSSRPSPSLGIKRKYNKCLYCYQTAFHNKRKEWRIDNRLRWRGAAPGRASYWSTSFFFFLSFFLLALNRIVYVAPWLMYCLSNRQTRRIHCSTYNSCYIV